MGQGELLVGGFQLCDQARLALAEQRHVVGLLLHLPRFLVFRGHVEKHDPRRILVSRQRNECPRRARWAFPWSGAETGVSGKGSRPSRNGNWSQAGCCGSQTRQSVVVQLSAGIDQGPGRRR